MSLEQIVLTYGYPALLIGTLLEGETVVVLAGFLAHGGYLNLSWVILIAFAGTFTGDQFYFYLGRAKGVGLLERLPRWKAKSDRIFQLLQKHQILVILAFRFLYGLRLVTPFVLGLSRVHPARFLVLNFIGAAVWAVVIAGLGYFLGQTLEVFLEEVKRYEFWTLIGIATIGFLVWIFYWWIQVKKSDKLRS